MRLLSNNTYVANVLMDLRLKQYLFLINSVSSDDIHFSDLHNDDFDFTNKKMIVPLTKKYRINYLLIDKNYFEDYEKEFNENSLRFSELDQKDSLVLLKCMPE